MKTKIIYSDNTMPFILSTLEEHCPLKHRELIIETTGAHIAGAKVEVCLDGHVHIFHGPLTPTASETLNVIHAYALALILDGRKKLSRKYSRKRIINSVEKVRITLANIDERLEDAFVRNIETLEGWLVSYMQEKEQSGEKDDTRPNPLRVTVPKVQSLINHSDGNVRFMRLFAKGAQKPGDC